MNTALIKPRIRDNTMKSDNAPITPQELRIWLEKLEELMDERDKRYEQKFTSIEKAFETAMASAEKQVTIASTASEKAINKAQEAQAAYDSHHNELVSRTVSMSTYESKMKDISAKESEQDKAINDLRESRSENTGKENRGTIDLARQQWSTSETIIVVALIANILLTLILHFAK